MPRSDCTCAGTAPGYPQHESWCGYVTGISNPEYCSLDCECVALRNSLEACRNAGESIRAERDEARDGLAAALARIRAIVRPVPGNGWDQDREWRFGYLAALDAVAAALAGPEPERRTCSHGYSPHCYPMCVDDPATPTEPTEETP